MRASRMEDLPCFQASLLVANHSMSRESDDRRPRKRLRGLVISYPASSLHPAHDRHRHVHLARQYNDLNQTKVKLTRMRSNGVEAVCRRLGMSALSPSCPIFSAHLYISSAISPLSATSILCPATSKSLTANFWFTRLSSASRILSIVSLIESPGDI